MKIFSIHLSRKEYFIFFFIFFISLLLFLFYVNLNAGINYFDEADYIERSQKIFDDGLFGYEDTTRTYLYFTFIASIKFISNDDLVTTKIIISVLQYAVYLSSVILIANYAVGKNYNKIIWHSVIGFGFLNPFLIQATTLLLTDIFASCFIVVSIFCLTRLDLNRSKFIIFTIGLFYAAVMIRPSTVIFLPIVVGLILFRLLKKKNINLLKVSLISLALLVIFVPQLYQNVTKQDEWTPLVVAPLYEDQISRAAKNMKHATVVIPGERFGMFYSAPFPVDHINVNIYQLFFENPPTFLFFYLSHIFGIFDWDYVDTYIKDYYSLDRIPASLLIYTTWFFVIYGIISARKNFFNTNRFLLTTIIISALLYLAFIATTDVEFRYGYPIFLLLLPFSGYGINQFYKKIIIHDNHKEKLFRNRMIFVITFTLFISVFLYSSFLFAFQTGRINWFNLF